LKACPQPVRHQRGKEINAKTFFYVNISEKKRGNARGGCKTFAVFPLTGKRDGVSRSFRILLQDTKKGKIGRWKGGR